MTSIERVLLAIFGFIVLFVSQTKGGSSAMEQEVEQEVELSTEEVTAGPLR